jgi:hypothetical protein
MPRMIKSTQFKYKLLRDLLTYCYPGDLYVEEDGMPVSWGVWRAVEYPHADKLRAAVLDALRAYITESPLKNKSASVVEIQRAYNEPTEFKAFVPTPSAPSPIYARPPLGRTVTEMLFQYIRMEGPNHGAICQQCEKVFLLAKPNQRFCSKQCNWDFWNGKRMEGYHAAMVKASRENKKRIKRIRAKKGDSK